MTPAFWRGKRVFLTGHTGFKGSWLSLWLQQLGAEVHGFALAPATTPSLFELADVARGMTSTLGDIRDLPALTAAMQAARPDIVIHMAAQALVRLGYVDPVGTYETNVMGTVKLLEAVRQVPGIRAVVVVSSDKCYENNEWPWGYRENEPMGGFDPYSSSKGCTELVCSAWRRSFFSPAEQARHGVARGSARAGTGVGGGDWAADRLVPDILRAIEAGQPVSIRNPGAIRPWQHVLEPLSGYLLLAEKLYDDGPRHAEGWNFGPADDDARPVSWIAERLTRQCDGSAGFQADDTSGQPHEAHFLMLDCAKARRTLGWHPRWTLSRALDQIAQWHNAYRLGSDMRSVTLQQIQAYQDSVPEL